MKQNKDREEFIEKATIGWKNGDELWNWILEFRYQSLDQNNKEWLKRVDGLKMEKEILDDGTKQAIISIGGTQDLKMIEHGLKIKNETVDEFNTSIDNLVNNFKEGKE